MRRGRLQLRLHRVENLRDILDVHHAAMGMEHLDEPAHVGAFEFLGQIDIHADGGNGVLQRAGLVADLDGETQTPNSNLVNAQFAVVPLALLVVQFSAVLSIALRSADRRVGFVVSKHGCKVTIRAGFAKNFLRTR